ncbi:MAG TPA: hypothetical protein VNZ45_16890, partial [Bacteroidia bacterium]|nr:hypothetical protein [Bacteroidia bacterium]
MKESHNKIFSLIVLLVVFCSVTIRAFGQEGEGLIAAPFNSIANKVPPGTFTKGSGNPQNTNTHRVMGVPINDNFASAINIPIGTTLTNQSTDGGSLEAGENLDCNSGAATSIWYSFTVGAATTLYINTQLTAGTFFVGTSVWSGSALPTGNCPAMQCQSSEFGPLAFTEQLTGLTTGQTYFIQISSISNADVNLISIGVTTAFPGGAFTLTNPMPASATSTCATAYAACYLNQCNPSAAQVAAAGCPSQAVTLNSNAVYTTCYTFSNSNSNAEVGIQAYVTSNCANACNGMANVNWMDWTVYNASCNLVGCGNLSNVKIDGAGCS